AQATRILFEGKRAVGVEYVQGKNKEKKVIRARREVILSSGAFQSPQLLQLSGVGDAADLGKHGIASVHNLPASARTCRTIPTSFSALPPTRRISPACPGAASGASSRASGNIAASAAGR